MIGKKDLETQDGKAKFEEYCRTVERFIKSKIFSQTIAEDLAQETIARVLEKLSKDETLKVNPGYFINTAKLVVLEHYRRQNTENTRFDVPPDTGDEIGTEKPIDAELRLQDFTEQKQRTIFNDCLLECFEERTPDEQVLLWRYSFEEKYRLEDDEPDSYKFFFASFLDSLRALRGKFLPLQDDHSPLTEDARVRISRLRKKLKICLSICITRKKGFA